MQYVEQTFRKLKNRFGEHYRKIKKPKKIDTFLYQHFKCTGHSHDNVLVQSVETLINDENSSHGRYAMFFFLVPFPSRSDAFWILRLIGFMIGITKCMRLHF